MRKANIKNEKMSDRGRERKKIICKITVNYHYKRKTLWNHLINHVEELENFALTKEISWKIFEFLKISWSLF